MVECQLLCIICSWVLDMYVFLKIYWSFVPRHKLLWNSWILSRLAILPFFRVIKSTLYSRANVALLLRRYLPVDSSWRLLYYKVFPPRVGWTRTIPSPVWALKIVQSVAFWWYFSWRFSFTHAQKSSCQRLKQALCSARELIHSLQLSLLRDSAPHILATLVSLNFIISFSSTYRGQLMEL